MPWLSIVAMIGELFLKFFDVKVSITPKRDSGGGSCRRNSRR